MRFSEYNVRMAEMVQANADLTKHSQLTEQENLVMKVHLSYRLEVFLSVYSGKYSQISRESSRFKCSYAQEDPQEDGSRG